MRLTLPSPGFARADAQIAGRRSSVLSVNPTLSVERLFWNRCVLFLTVGRNALSSLTINNSWSPFSKKRRFTWRRKGVSLRLGNRHYSGGWHRISMRPYMRRLTQGGHPMDLQAGVEPMELEGFVERRLANKHIVVTHAALLLRLMVGVRHYPALRDCCKTKQTREAWGQQNLQTKRGWNRTGLIVILKAGTAKTIGHMIVV